MVGFLARCPGLLLALPGPHPHGGVTVFASETQPGGGLWLAPIALEKTGGNTYVSLRGYDAAGTLLCDDIPQ